MKTKKAKLSKKDLKALKETWFKDKKGKPFYKLNRDSDRLYGVVSPRVVDWIFLSFKLKCVASAYEYKNFISDIHEIFKSRGDVSGLEWVKGARLAVMKFLEGNPLTSGSVSLLPCGLPRLLAPRIRDALKIGSTSDIRMVLTILNASRALALGTDPDTGPITDPSNRGVGYPTLVKDMEDHAVGFWKANGYQWKLGDGLLPRALRFRTYHFTTKTGPNGHAL